MSFHGSQFNQLPWKSPTIGPHVIVFDVHGILRAKCPGSIQVSPELDIVGGQRVVSCVRVNTSLGRSSQAFVSLCELLSLGNVASQLEADCGLALLTALFSSCIIP